jgi:OHCU decarboxylase
VSLKRLNELTRDEAMREFLKCCGSKRWAEAMIERRPFENVDGLTQTASDVWWSLKHDDWLEAFRRHPKIGEKKAAEAVPTQSQQWSGKEQSGMHDAGATTIEALAQLNREYEEKFGYIFIVCATGKSADEMLALLRQRLPHDPDTELPIAAAEQAKITELRLKKLIN